MDTLDTFSEAFAIAEALVDKNFDAAYEVASKLPGGIFVRGIAPPGGPRPYFDLVRPPDGCAGEDLRVSRDGTITALRVKCSRDNTDYLENSWTAHPGAIQELLNDWLVYLAEQAKELAEVKSRVTMRNRQLRDLRRSVRKQS